ncbi:MAG: hypothetical protein LUP91_15450, partial [Methylococcaceae bacterium]|nr:hypothetical protein [Methylococcaceae bacterium]
MWNLIQFSAEYILRGDDVFERRAHDFSRPGGNHIELETVSAQSLAQDFGEQLDIVFEPDALAC